LVRPTPVAWSTAPVRLDLIVVELTQQRCPRRVLRRLTIGLTAQLTAALVMLIWGVASDALRDLITGFFSNISFGG
jgi:hypothetical protein